jgi:hypothetical protein
MRDAGGGVLATGEEKGRLEKGLTEAVIYSIF